MQRTQSPASSSSSAKVKPIESEYEGFRDGKLRYKIEVEVEGFSSSTAAQCSCAIALGNIASVAPESLEVTGALGQGGHLQPDEIFERIWKS